jgi:hypothetical protein
VNNDGDNDSGDDAEDERQDASNNLINNKYPRKAQDMFKQRHEVAPAGYCFELV